MIIGYCYNFMPIVSGAVADYRFKSKDLVDFYGWTLFSGTPKSFTINYSTVLMGAF